MEHKLQNVDEAIFENTYTVTPKSSIVTDQIKATKSLTGRDLKEGEFSFELVEGDEVVATGTNAADGKITMSPSSTLLLASTPTAARGPERRRQRHHLRR